MLPFRNDGQLGNSRTTTVKVHNNCLKLNYLWFARYLQVSSSLCVTPCPQVSKSASSAFSISGLSPVSNENLGACNNDYLVIVGGYDPTQPHGPNNSQDRYCGSQLNVENNAATSSTVCSKFQYLFFFKI